MGVNFWQRSDSSDPTASPHEFGLRPVTRSPSSSASSSAPIEGIALAAALPHDRRSGAMLR